MLIYWLQLIKVVSHLSKKLDISMGFQIFLCAAMQAYVNMFLIQVSLLKCFYVALRAIALLLDLSACSHSLAKALEFFFHRFVSPHSIHWGITYIPIHVVVFFFLKQLSTLFSFIWWKWNFWHLKILNFFYNSDLKLQIGLNCVHESCFYKIVAALKTHLS